MPYPGQPKRIRVQTKNLDEVASIAAGRNVYTLADPTALSIVVELPDGTETTYSWPAGTIVKDATGRFHVDHTCATSGDYAAKASATGAVVASDQAVWTILPTRVA